MSILNRFADVELTIVIPTYNRLEKLQQTVNIIAPQLKKDVSLLIIDNASPVSVESNLIIPKLPFDGRIKIIRNQTNIGGNANIARAIELCETRWLWILGDDDCPALDAVSEIKRAIRSHPEAIFIKSNFRNKDHRWRDGDVVCGTRSDFFREASTLGEIMFISSSVVNAAKLRADAAKSFHYAMSCAPILSAILGGDLERKEYAFSSCQFLLEPASPEREETYSTLTLLLGVGLLRDIPTSRETAIALSGCIGRTAKCWRPRQVMKELLFNQSSFSRSRYLYLEIWRRFFRLGSLSLNIEAIVCAVLLFFPRVTRQFVSWLKQVRVLKFRYIGNVEGSRL